MVTLLGLSLPTLFSGAVFIEAIFAWPGVGRVLVEAVQARDYPVVMAATAVSAMLVVLGNLLAEALVRLGRSRGLDERRHGSSVAQAPAPTLGPRSGSAVLALAALAAVLAPLLAGDPIAPAGDRGHPVPAAASPPTRWAPSTCSAPTASGGTCGPGWSTARGCRSASARWRCCSRCVIGVAVGAAAGFWRGWLGVALLGLTDFALALPRVVLLLLLASLWQPSAGW